MFVIQFIFRSWLIFKLLDASDLTWMVLPVSEWKKNNEFRRINEIVNKIICVNDVAKQNVQNVTRYANYVASCRLDTVIKVVNQHRAENEIIHASKKDLMKL